MMGCWYEHQRYPRRAREGCERQPHDHPASTQPPGAKQSTSYAAVAEPSWARKAGAAREATRSTEWVSKPHASKLTGGDRQRGIPEGHNGRRHSRLVIQKH